MFDPSIQSKILIYDEFLETKLKEDLKLAQNKLERLREEKQHWMDAKLNFKMLRYFKTQCSGQDLEMEVALAEWDNKSIIAMGTVTHLDQVHIEIGCGVRLSMDLSEADKYTDIRIRAIDRQIKHYMDLAVQVKVHIKVTLLAINELVESSKETL